MLAITDGRLVDAPGSVMTLIRLVVAVFAAHAPHFKLPASLRLKWYCLLEKDHLEKKKTKPRKLCSSCHSIGNILVASFLLFFFLDINMFNEMLHKSKALKRRIGAINIKHSLHNTHSWNDLFHRLKGHVELAVRYRKWWLGPGLRIRSWVRKFGVGRGRGWAGLCHTNTIHRVRSLQNIKFPPAILSCNIHVDTTETTIMSRFSRVLMSSLAVNGG